MSLIRASLRKMKGYRLAQPGHLIKLNQNESPVEIPGALQAALLETWAKLAWNRYPTPFADGLRAALGAKLGWDPEGIVAANGSNVLVQALLLLIERRQKVLVVEPGFSLYALEAELLGNPVVRIPLEKDFSLPRERLLAAIRRQKPALIFISNPNAPTGTLFPETALLEVVKAAPGLVVIDEAYLQYSGVTLFPRLAKAKNLILLRTFSKAFALAGMRIGYLLAAPAIAREVRKAVLPFCLSPLAEAAAILLLEQEAWVAEQVERTREERAFLFEGLEQFEGVKVFPSAANFLLFQVPSAKRTFADLVARGILVRDVSGHGGLKNALRVSVGTPQENRAFLEAMEALFSVRALGGA